jgi:hypothetical protein
VIHATAMTLYQFCATLLIAAMALALLAYTRVPWPPQRVYRLAGLLTALSLAAAAAGLIAAGLQVNGSAICNAFIAAEALLVLAAVRAQQPAWGPRLAAVGAAGIAALAIDLSVLGSLNHPLSVGLAVNAALLAAVLGAQLWRLATRSVAPVQRVPAFWLFAGMLLHFIALPPVTALAQLVAPADPALARALWSVPLLLGTLRYLLAAFAFRLASAKPGA